MWHTSCYGSESKRPFVAFNLNSKLSARHDWRKEGMDDGGFRESEFSTLAQYFHRIGKGTLS